MPVNTLDGCSIVIEWVETADEGSVFESKKTTGGGEEYTVAVAAVTQNPPATVCSESSAPEGIEYAAGSVVFRRGRGVLVKVIPSRCPPYPFHIAPGHKNIAVLAAGLSHSGATCAQRISGIRLHRPPYSDMSG